MPKENPLRIIPEQKIESPKWVNYVVFACLVPFVASCGLYLFFTGQVPLKEAERDSLKSQIIALDQDIENQKAEKEIREISNKISDFSIIFNERKLASRFFYFLKIICHPQVQFISFELSVKDLTAHINAKSSSFQALGEQVLVLKDNTKLEDSKVFNILLDKEGAVNFTLSFKFKQDLLKHE